MDADRLGELIDQHAAALELYAAQWTCAPEDCVQEAFVELARQPHPPKSRVAWLYRVVRNRAINAGRSERRRQRYEHAAASLHERLKPNQSSTAEEAQEVALALGRLDEVHRETVVLRIWSGLTLDEIAGLVGCSTSTVHRRYQQALAELRNLLEETTCHETNRCR